LTDMSLPLVRCAAELRAWHMACAISDSALRSLMAVFSSLPFVHFSRIHFRIGISFVVYDVFISNGGFHVFSVASQNGVYLPVAGSRVGLSRGRCSTALSSIMLSAFRLGVNFELRGYRCKCVHSSQVWVPLEGDPHDLADLSQNSLTMA
jgi:hypothetical protein